MNSTLFTFHVSGDSYWELREKADSLIFDFLREDDDFDEEDLHTVFSISYELTVDENQDMSVDSAYSATVAARIKTRRE